MMYNVVKQGSADDLRQSPVVTIDLLVLITPSELVHKTRDPGIHPLLPQCRLREPLMCETPLRIPVGHVFVLTCMHCWVPQKFPIKGLVSCIAVSQSLALESLTPPRTLAMTSTPGSCLCITPAWTNCNLVLVCFMHW